MNYQITDIQTHNIEVALINAATQVQHLQNMLTVATGQQYNGKATEVCLEQLQNAQRILDKLQTIPFIDLEADTQKSK